MRTRGAAVVRAVWHDVAHPPDADSALALLAFVALVVNPVLAHKVTHLTPGVVALAAVTALPLTARRHHPVAVLALVVPLILACLAVFHPNTAAVGVTMCAVFSVGMVGDRVRSLVVGGLMAPVVAGAVLLTSPGHRVEPLGFVAYLALVLGSLAAGEAVRARQALLRAVAERSAREQLAEARQRSSAERLELANEVHDIVGHALVAIQVQASAAAHLQRRQPGTAAPRTLDDIAAIATEALTDLRSTLKTLRAPADPVPLRPAAAHAPADPVPLRPVQDVTELGQLVRGVRAAGLDVRVQMPPGVPDVLPPDVAHVGYRIIQEGLTNVLRHSAARSALVRVGVDAAQMVVEVADGGPRRGEATAGSGRGIPGMAERATAVGGVCEAGPDGGDGWRVRVRIPLAEGRR